MGNMFDNYSCIPQHYIPTNTTEFNFVHKAVKFPLEELNAKGEVIGYSWNYMDDIVLEFCTEGEVLYDIGAFEDAESYLGDKKFIISFYNFKYEKIYEELINASANCKYYISDELKKKLIPNTYGISLVLYDGNENITHTLIDKKDFKVFVR